MKPISEHFLNLSIHYNFKKKVFEKCKFSSVTVFVLSIKGFQIVNHKCETNLCTVHVLWVE